MIEQEIDNICILKFGGTSVGNAEAIDRMTGIVSNYQKEGWQPVVVLSAMNGTTNRLVRLCEGVLQKNQTAINHELEVLKDAHFTAISDLSIPNYFRERAKEDLHNLFLGLETETKRSEASNKEIVDRRLSYGERLMVRMAKWKFLGMGISAEVIDATSIIKTDDNFGEAKPDCYHSNLLSRELLNPLLRLGIIPVVTGFIGSTFDGRLTTLGRGGSDYTASLLGRFLNARQVLIYTDVDGVFTKDPNIHSDATLLSLLSYEQADRKAKNGEKVLYSKTIEPLIGTNTDLWVKNSFNLVCAGTRITSKLF